MAGIKRNIRRPSKSKQVSDELTASRSSKSTDSKKIHPVISYKKSMFRSRQEGKGPRQTPRSQEISGSVKTAQSEYSELTADEGLFDVFGIDASSVDLDEMRKSFTNEKNSSPRTNRPVIEFKNPKFCQPKRRSWVSSSWDADVETESEDELDPSIYTLLECEQKQEHLRKLSLHDVLVEEELSFRKSLVWNDDDKSATE